MFFHIRSGDYQQKTPAFKRNAGAPRQFSVFREDREAGDCQSAFSITHHDMSALPNDGEPCFFKGSHCLLVGNAVDLRHGLGRSDGDKLAMKSDTFSCKLPLLIFGGALLPKPDGLSDIFEGLSSRFPLTPTARQRRTANRKAFLALDQCNRECHVEERRRGSPLSQAGRRWGKFSVFAENAQSRKNQQANSGLRPTAFCFQKSAALSEICG